MQIIEGNREIQIVTEAKSEVLALKEHFSVPHPQARMIKNRKPFLKDWDGRVHFAKVRRGCPPNILFLPVGFLGRLLKYLADEEVNYEFEAKVKLPPIEFKQYLTGDDGNPLILDPTQVLACKALLANRRASIELGTGSGKTEIALNAFECVRHTPGLEDVRMVFAVPKLNLLNQTVSRVEKRLPWLKNNVGVVGEGEFLVDSQVVVGTVQTISGGEHILRADEIREWLETVDMLIVDEAHHSQSFQGQSLITLCPGRWLWGVSAKLTFQDKKNVIKHWTLEGLFGPPVFRGRSEERTAPTTIISHRNPDWNGFLEGDNLEKLAWPHAKGKRLYTSYINGLPVRFRLEANGEWFDGFWRGPDEDGIVDVRTDPDLCMMKNRFMVPDKTKFGVYQRVGDAWQKVENPFANVYWNTHDIGIVYFKPRNDWAVSLAFRCANKSEPFVVSVKRARHAAQMHSALKRAGMVVESVTGRLSGEQQTKLFEAVTRRKIHGVVAMYSIVAEGVDIPNLTHLIKLDGIYDEQVLTQQRGRVERVFPGKPMGYVHVPADNHEERLARSARKVIKFYKTLPADKRPILKVENFE